MSEIQVYNLGLGFESVNVVNEFIQMKPLQQNTWSGIFVFRFRVYLGFAF